MPQSSVSHRSVWRGDGVWRRGIHGRWGIVDWPGSPDELRDAVHRVWMRQYLNREPSTVWEVERRKGVAREVEIAQLESLWALPER